MGSEPTLIAGRRGFGSRFEAASETGSNPWPEGFQNFGSVRTEAS
jgi:hypothetical protein